MNPRPKILPFCIYMLSSGLKSRICFSPGTEMFRCQPKKDLACQALSTLDQPACRVDAPNPAPQARAGGTAQQVIKLLMRSYNRLRLYLIPPF